MLENISVAQWVAASYPIVLVDEAQELAPARLRIIRALAPHVALYVAADEFQCLDETIDTVPFRQLIERKANLHRAYGHHRPVGIPVITIQSAKNRQFRNVIVLWGPGVPGDAQRKARLLYNAITRAETHCRIFVQTQPLLVAPPFTVPTE